ncbi:MAG: RsmB/NOP family class I SAM-dependent RNA methyltransferase [Bacteroidetes bacterium]|nr:RsmB/NOP family class I SAM-dependent RNA methyltransferase [Bacteroidota bacterium]
MSRYFSLINRALDFINQYNGDAPLEYVLKQYFKQNKVMGSTDRKNFKQLIYNYYRILGNNTFIDTNQVLHFASALIPTIARASLEIPDLEDEVSIENIRSKLQLDDTGYFLAQLEISDEIDTNIFIKSHFYQPEIFIRVNQKYREQLEKSFTEKNIQYSIISDHTWLIEGVYPLTDTEAYLNGFFEIQDFASQQTIAFMQPKENSTWWDCCAGSGGKSLLLLEKMKNLNLFASDSRLSILENYKERLARHGYNNINVQHLNLSTDDVDLNVIPMCDGIIADVPCTGSGTWRRSPAYLQHFNIADINFYAQLQRSILKNIVTKLNTGGALLYITCSVYKVENENNVEYISNELQLLLQSTQYLTYSDKGADTMFVAVFKK